MNAYKTMPMKLARSTLALAIAAMACPAAGNTIRVDLAAMPEAADVIALVKIESGELVTGTDGRPCGATYKARILHAAKGALDESVITFGPFVGKSVGLQYFVFLTHAGSSLDSTYGGFVGASRVQLVKEHRNNCKSELPVLREMYEGFGSIPVVAGRLVEYRPAVRLSNFPYIFPVDLKAARAPGGFEIDGVFFGTVEMEVGDFYDFIRSVISPRK